PSLSLLPSAFSVCSTLSLHDALPIYYIGLPYSCPAGCDDTNSDANCLARTELSGNCSVNERDRMRAGKVESLGPLRTSPGHTSRSEEHTSELQSRENLVCRLLLEKKK